MADRRSPRVNKALMSKYIGQSVRVMAKLITFKDDAAIVETSDGGEVEVKLLKDFSMDCTYLEIIGTVVDERRMKMVGWIALGDDVDMKLVEQTVQIWHDPRFAKVFGS